MLKECRADRDGECYHKNCPQIRDGEPEKSGRHCPLDTDFETGEYLDPIAAEKELSKQLSVKRNTTK